MSETEAASVAAERCSAATEQHVNNVEFLFGQTFELVGFSLYFCDAPVDSV